MWLVSKMEGKANFSRRLYRPSGTGIVECLEIIDVDLKQFDGLTWLTLTAMFYDLRRCPIGVDVKWSASSQTDPAAAASNDHDVSLPSVAVSSAMPPPLPWRPTSPSEGSGTASCSLRRDAFLGYFGRRQWVNELWIIALIYRSLFGKRLYVCLLWRIWTNLQYVFSLSLSQNLTVNIGFEFGSFLCKWLKASTVKSPA